MADRLVSPRKIMIKEHIKVIKSLDINEITRIASVIVKAFEDGNKLLVAGNGGSAADAQHFVAELVGKFEKKRKGLPAIALNTNNLIITAVANDCHFNEVFARQIEALAERYDIFFAISTSGNSKNIIKALSQAKKIGCFTIGLTGRDGGKMAKGYCNYLIKVDSDNTARIQEAHILIIHIICKLIEDALF